jgi:hypothetical protein
LPHRTFLLPPACLHPTASLLAAILFLTRMRPHPTCHTHTHANHTIPWSLTHDSTPPLQVLLQPLHMTHVHSLTPCFEPSHPPSPSGSAHAQSVPAAPLHAHRLRPAPVPPRRVVRPVGHRRRYRGGGGTQARLPVLVFVVGPERHSGEARPSLHPIASVQRQPPRIQRRVVPSSIHPPICTAQSPPPPPPYNPAPPSP